jgi:membrane-bound lytic murein transglycosylase D
MRKIIIFMIFFNINNLYALDFDYKWTDNHPILNNYIKENREHILKIAPYKHEKSKEYKKFIEAVMKTIDVPKELIVLAGIESNFTPDAKSHAGAIGMWQFMTPTAKDMGLIINDTIDERKDWKKSSIAGIKYLKWMAEKHFDGNYELAILAYNAGIGKVSRAMKKYDSNDPWYLIEKKEFKQESKEFLPKFIAYMNYYFYVEKHGNLN